MTESLRQKAQDAASIVFQGLVSRDKLVDLMASAKICVSPQLVSRTLGNQFAFKVIEYLAAGAHVVMTPMGLLEPEIEAGVTYLADNRPDTIAATLKAVIAERRYQCTAADVVHEKYGPKAVSEALDRLVMDATGRSNR